MSGKNTTFVDINEEAEDGILYSCEPRLGRILLYEHKLLHEEEELRDDQKKYVIRTDILYRRYNEETEVKLWLQNEIMQS